MRQDLITNGLINSISTVSTRILFLFLSGTTAYFNRMAGNACVANKEEHNLGNIGQVKDNIFLNVM